MYVTITSIELNGPLKFFWLSKAAFKVIQQLRTTNCKAFKKKGVWTKHYTMTLWNTQDELKAFASSGAHLEAMKQSRKIAREIRTITFEAHELPNWPSAMTLLETAKVIRF